MSDAVKYGRYVWSADLQGSIDSVGRYLGKFDAANLPTLTLAGQEYLDETTMTFYKYNGDAWVEMSGSFIGERTANTQQDLDANAVGKEIYRTDLDEFRKWNGNQWVPIGSAGDSNFQILVRTDFPTTPEDNSIVYRTDREEYWIYDSAAATWRLMAGRARGFLGEYASSFPDNNDVPEGLQQGDKVYRTDIGEFFIWDGDYWVEI